MIDFFYRGVYHKYRQDTRELAKNKICAPKEITVFGTREEGLNALEKLTNTYYHYQHFSSKNRYEILLHALEEEYWDEDFEEWCFSGDYDTISNWEGC